MDVLAGDLPSWWPLAAALCALGALGGVLASLGLAGPRYWRGGPELRRSIRLEVRIRLTWRTLFRQTRVTMQDVHVGSTVRTRVQIPPLAWTRATRHGVELEMRTVPQVDHGRVKDAVEDLTNAWRAVRIIVRQPAAGRITMRVLHTDPLTTIADAEPPPPIGTDPAALRSVLLGLDEAAEEIRLKLANSSGIGIYGTPGFGKSACIRWLITRLSPSRAMQFVVLDGKTATGIEGDYADLAPRISALVGDDLADANALLAELVELRRTRSSTIRAERGRASLWDAGPTPEWPVVMVIVDEAHTYMQTIPGGGNEAAKERNRLAGSNFLLLEDLAKKGRSVGIVLVLATQKGTADAIPTSIRDVLTASISFAVRTLAAAIAALGPSIVDHPDANPVGFLRDEYRGVASMAAEGMPGFTRFRVPFVPDDLAADVARATAHFVRTLPGVRTGLGHRIHTAPPSRPPTAKRSTRPPARPGPKTTKPTPTPAPAAAPSAAPTESAQTSQTPPRRRSPKNAPPPPPRRRSPGDIPR